jgi:NADPH:quinone reductase-like Zn-dependent oxidoreductase
LVSLGKSALYGKRAGVVSGCDFSGIVEEIGSNVPHGLRSIGERVAGFVLGGQSYIQYLNPIGVFLYIDKPSSRAFTGLGVQHCGAFCEYLVTYADFVVHLPDTWSFENAAQLGIAPLTALMALHELLGLPESHLPPDAAAADRPHFPILISGGASSVGQYAVQLAKLSGLYVIATASERNFSLLRSLGADVVVDYRDPVQAAKQIREAAPGPIEHAVDCVSTGTSFEIVAGSLDGKGTIANLTLGDYPLVEGAKAVSGIIFNYFGKVRSRLKPDRINPSRTAAPFFQRENC